MKKTFLKPIAVAALFSATFFSCAGSGENTTTAENTQTGAEIYEEEPLEPEEEKLSDAVTVDYGNLFESVDETENYDVLALARMEPGFSTFVELVEMSGLAPSFYATGELVEGDITVFIPTNEAFAEMPEEEFELLTDPANQAKLALFIQRHVLPNEVPSIQFQSNQIVETLVEEEIPVTTEMGGTQVYVGGAQIMKADIEASNGIIHVVNRVIEPGEFTDVTPD